MKKVFQLSLSLMLILAPTTSCSHLAKVEQKESKNAEPSTYEFMQIQIAQLPYQPPVATPQPTVETEEVTEVKKVTAEKVKALSYEDEKAAKKNRIADKLDEHLEGKLADKGMKFAEEAMANEVDPYLIAAIAIHETGNGKSPAIQNKNNVGGMMGSKGLMRFSSVNESIETLTALIKNSYVDKGRDTIQAISEIYAPIGADNDPKGLNGAWVDSVSQIYHMLKSDVL